jgi:hypothetical protein
MPLLYIDPGSGTLLWQALVSGALGALFYFRQSIGLLLGLRKRKKDDEPSPPPPAERGDAE